MQNIIKELLDIDRRGRNLVEEAESRREKISEEIKSSTDSIKDKLERRAQVHLERTRSEYDMTAKEHLAAAESDYERRLAAMEELYETNKEQWAKTLAERCIAREHS